MTDHDYELQRYSVSIVTQNKHRFYTLTMDSDVLAKCCFVTTRDEDPQLGFQRFLDVDRATAIANYLDSGLGTIPNAIILSAQEDSHIKDVGKGKTIEFAILPHSFLVIDGQHRVYGFSKASSRLRVPVVIYTGLTRQQETQLFIDINTKQRPVPPELLLDIKKLAESENNTEQYLGQIFDLFNNESNSALAGMLSAATRSSGKISRVTFYSALKPLIPILSDRDLYEAYETYNNYLLAIKHHLAIQQNERTLINPTIFKTFSALFKSVAQRVKDRHGRKYTADNFSGVLKSVFDQAKKSHFQSPGNSFRDLAKQFSKYLSDDFSL